MPKAMKKCARPTCSEPWKPISAYSHKTGTSDGLNPWCRPCQAKAMADSRAKNKPDFDPDITLVEKFCYGHKTVHPIAEFGPDRKNSDGYRNVCKNYNSEKAREYRAQKKAS